MLNYKVKTIECYDIIGIDKYFIAFDHELSSERRWGDVAVEVVDTEEVVYINGDILVDYQNRKELEWMLQK